MKTLIKTALIISILIGTNACYVQQPLAVTPSNNNKTYTIDYLFEHDGCKLYRFYDNGHYVYFSNCNNSVISAEKDSTQIKVTTTIGNKQ